MLFLTKKKVEFKKLNLKLEQKSIVLTVINSLKDNI